MEKDTIVAVATPEGEGGLAVVRLSGPEAVAKAGRVLATFDGAAEGKILTRPTGKSGFGYDPIFFHPGVGRSFAELTREEKEGVSHRGEAIRRLVEAIRRGELDLS